MKKIAIIGAGMMGSAMSFPAADNGYKVSLVGTPLDRDIIERAAQDGYHITLKCPLPRSVECFQFEDVKKALNGAELVIGGVSSFGIDWFAENVLPLMRPETPLLMITKGLKTDENHKFIPFPLWLMSHPNGKGLSINAVGGPCISFELAARQHTEVAFCGSDIKTVKKIRDMLKTGYYHITATDDICGIETAVAMKNAYALGVSLAVGQAQRDDDDAPEKYNPQAGLFYQATKEMDYIISGAGGGKNALYFGAGDLYVTVFGGRTRRLGTLLGKGLNFSEALDVLAGVTLESVAITKVVCAALEKRGEMQNCPLLCHINDLINEKPDAEIPWDSFAE